MSIEATTITDDIALAARAALGLLTEAETAKILDVEPTTLATWRGQRKGPAHVKLGKSVFYTVDLLEDWINRSYEEQHRGDELRDAA